MSADNRLKAIEDELRAIRLILDNSPTAFAPPGKWLLTMADVAKQLKVAPGTVKNWVHKKKIPYQKINRAVRFDQTRLDSWIQQRTVGATIGGKKIN